MKRVKAVLAGGLVLLLGSAVLFAESDLSKVIREKGQKQAQLENLNKQIKDVQKRKQKVLKEEQKVFSDLEEIDLRMAFINQELSITRGQINEAHDKIIQLRQQLTEAQQAEIRNTFLLNQNVRLIYKQGRYGITRFLFSSQDFYTFLKRLKFMRMIARQNGELLKRLKDEQFSVASMIQELKVKKGSELVLAKQTRAKEAELKAQKKSRSALLKKLKKRENYYTSWTKDQAKAASRLENLVQVYAKSATRIEKEKKLAQLSFKQRKGGLAWPVSGRLLSRFGKVHLAEYKTYENNRGIEIGAREGASVETVGRGTVWYAAWLEGYGNTVIVDHGSNLYSLYGHLQDISVQVNESLDSKAIVGHVGVTGSLSDTPNLYFEIIQNGEPKDPMKWLSAK